MDDDVHFVATESAQWSNAEVMAIFMMLFGSLPGLTSDFDMQTTYYDASRICGNLGMIIVSHVVLCYLVLL